MKQFSPAHLFEIFKKSGGAMLSLDIGAANVGVARSFLLENGNRTMVPIDDHKYLPYSVLRRHAKDHKYEPLELIDQLHKIVSELHVTAMVAGCPLDRYSKDASAKATEHIYPFFRNLRNSGKFSGVPYALWEEKYTTEVEKPERSRQLTDRTKKRIKDIFAATLTGQDFFNTMESRHCQSASIEAQTAWRLYLNNHHRCFSSSPQGICLSEFVTSIHQLFLVDRLEMTKEELYHKIFMSYEYDEEDQIEEKFDELEKLVPGLIHKKVHGGDILYSIDEKMIKLVKD